MSCAGAKKSISWAPLGFCGWGGSVGVFWGPFSDGSGFDYKINNKQGRVIQIGSHQPLSFPQMKRVELDVCQCS